MDDEETNFRLTNDQRLDEARQRAKQEWGAF